MEKLDPLSVDELSNVYNLMSAGPPLKREARVETHQSILRSGWHPPVLKIGDLFRELYLELLTSKKGKKLSKLIEKDTKNDRIFKQQNQ